MKALKNLLQIEKEANELILNASKEKENLIILAEKEGQKYENDLLTALNKDIKNMEQITNDKLNQMSEEHQSQLKETKESLAKNIDKRIDKAFNYLLEVIFK